MKNKELYIGLLIGFLIGLLVLKACNTTTITPPIIIPTKEIKETIKRDTLIPTKKIDSLININKKLSKSEYLLRFQLALFKDKSNTLELQVTNLEKDKESSTIINDYIEVNKLKDTICDSLVDNLKNQINNRDSIIVQKDTIIQIQKRYLTLSLNQQDKLNKYSIQLNKEIKKQKVNNILWKAGTIIVAGLIIKNKLK